MIRQSLFRQSFSRIVLRLFAFSFRGCNGGKKENLMCTHRHPSCVLFQKPMHCFETTNKHWFSDDPSCIRITLPALTPTMETGTIVKWYKSEGESLEEGDALVDIETDKAIMAFESPYRGYLAKILIPEGAKNVPIGKMLCVIVENNEDIKTLKEECYAVQAPAPEVTPAETIVVPVQPPAAPVEPVPAVPIPVAPTPAVPMEDPPAPLRPALSPPSGKRVFASPLAVKIAAQKGIDLRTIAEGTGIWNSIKAADLQKASPTIAAATIVTPPAATITVPVSSYREQPITGKANLIAMDLAKSKQTVPHFYLMADINVINITAYCEKFNEDLKDDVKLGVRDFIIKAAALSCIAVPETNSSWMNTFIREYKSVNINIAIYLPSGLVTPVMLDTEKRTISDINKNVKVLVQKAKEQKLDAKDVEIGTFTVTYLGKYNISTFAPIIRPPQSCALAVGATEKRFSALKDTVDRYKVDEFLTATLSCDHRVVDGAKGAQWLQKFKNLLEEPQSMLS